jgi:hypothetical protein
MSSNKGRKPAKASKKKKFTTKREGKRTLKTSLPRAVRSNKFQSPIHLWLEKAKAQGLAETKDSKIGIRGRRVPGTGVRVSDVNYAAADTSLAGSFVDLNRVYRFRLGGHTTIGYTTGTLDDFFPCDPSASGLGFPEWTTLAALFSEFKLVSLTIQLVRQRQQSSDYNTQFNNPIMIAGNLGTAIAPGSYSALADNADSFMWNASQSTSDRGIYHTLHGTGLNYSQVTTPTTEPYAGAPGSIQVFGTATSGVPNDVIHALVIGIYDFRSRV